MSGKRHYGGMCSRMLSGGIRRYNEAGISTRQLEATLLACGVSARLRDYTQGNSRPSLTMLVLWIWLFDWARFYAAGPVRLGRCPAPINRIRQQLHDAEAEARQGD